MAYWLDEKWHLWPEVLQVGTPAAGLYSRCGSYVADVQTDGFIPTAVARMYGTPEWIGRLVEVGLWQIEEHGFRDTRYFPLNKTKAEIDEAKRKAAARQQRFRTKKPATRKSRDSHALRDALVTMVPSPSSPNGEGTGAREGPGRKHKPDPDPISGHCRICDFPAANTERHTRPRGAA